MKLTFDNEKDKKLIAERGVSFDEICDEIVKNNFLAIEDHPNQSKYPNQKIIYVPLGKEIYVVPFVVEEDGTYFLKTIFPSRKARKKFLKGNKTKKSIK